MAVAGGMGQELDCTGRIQSLTLLGVADGGARPVVPQLSRYCQCAAQRRIGALLCMYVCVRVCRGGVTVAGTHMWSTRGSMRREGHKATGGGRRC